jgi:SAM-dependent methyltransferase
MPAPLATAPRLNLGCGTDIRPGYINLDIAALPGVDVVHDLGTLPLPFPDEMFEEINCKDILEHLDFIPVVREIHRILRPGGRVIIEAPHFTSPAVWIDPTHKTAFSADTFAFFVADSSRAYYFDFHFTAVVDRRIVFHRYRWQPWNYVVEPLVNLRPAFQTFYEETFLARLFPAANVRITLVK